MKRGHARNIGEGRHIPEVVDTVRVLDHALLVVRTAAVRPLLIPPRLDVLPLRLPLERAPHLVEALLRGPPAARPPEVPARLPGTLLITVAHHTIPIQRGLRTRAPDERVQPPGVPLAFRGERVVHGYGFGGGTGVRVGCEDAGDFVQEDAADAERAAPRVVTMDAPGDALRAEGEAALVDLLRERACACADES